MLKTHTGTRIDTARFSWSCGNWSVPYIGIAERRPGRARQMRRMVAKARRRERRGYVPPAVKRARVVSAARAEVRLGGKVIGYASDFKLTLDTLPAERVRETEGGFSIEGPPIRADDLMVVDTAGDRGAASMEHLTRAIQADLLTWRGEFAPPVTIDVSNVPPAELDELKARLRVAIDSGKTADWRLIPLGDEPETEFERAAVNVARGDVARGDVVSFDDAKVDLAGGEG